MHKNDIISAIDIGTTKIVAVIGRKTENGKYEILGIGKKKSQGIRRGVVLNIEETVVSISDAVKVAEEQAGLKMNDVYVGIAGEHIRSKCSSGYVQLGPDEDEITEAHTQELESQMFNTSIEPGEEIIHVIPQQFSVDKLQGIENPIGVTGKRLEGSYHIVIGQKSAGNNIKKCVTRVGLNVKKLILEPFASAKAVLTDDEREAGVLMIDIGGGTTDIAVFSNKIFQHSAVIPLGGYSVTKDIKTGCNILVRYAESIKVDYGSALQMKKDKNKVIKIPGISGRAPKDVAFHHLSGIIQARMEEIIDIINYDLESVDVKNMLGAGVVITGGGSLLKNLPQLVSYKTGMESRIGKPRIPLVVDSTNVIGDPSFATAIGLIMMGFEDVKSKDDNSSIENKFIEEKNVKKNNDKNVVVKKTEPKYDISLKDNEGFKKVKGFFSGLFDVKDTNM